MNPNIAMGFQRPRFDASEGQRNALAMQQSQMQMAANMMQMDQARRTAERDTASRNALAGVDWTNPSKGLIDARNVLAGAGDLQSTLALNKSIEDQGVAQRQRDKEELAAGIQIAGGMNQANWAQGYGMLRQYAPGLAQRIPEQHSPEAEGFLRSVALGAGKIQDQNNADRSAKFDREKFDYQQQQDAEKNQILRDKNAATNNGAKAATLSNEAGLRKEYTTGSNDFVVVRDAYKKVERIAQRPSPANDLAMVFSIMKIYDPTSVVRETEQASARNAAGVPDQIRNTWNRLLTGENLNPRQRVDFVNSARDVMQSQMESHLAYRDEISRIANESGISPSKVIIDYVKGLNINPMTPLPEDPAKPIPKTGAVMKGYQFMGGDPNDPTSWRKLSK